MSQSVISSEKILLPNITMLFEDSILGRTFCG